VRPARALCKPTSKWKFPSTGSRRHSHPSLHPIRTPVATSTHARRGGISQPGSRKDTMAHITSFIAWLHGRRTGRSQGLLSPETEDGAQVGRRCIARRFCLCSAPGGGSDNGTTQNGLSVCLRTTTAGSPSTLQLNSRCVHRGLRWTRPDRGGSPAPVVG
jgi:hypothetical protein